MAKRVRDQALDSRQGRERLKARGKPYWRLIEQGVHLGYRRLKGRAGTWSVRHYLGNQTYRVEAIGEADDLSDADGVKILNYWQAQDKAREQMKVRAHAGAGINGPLTVGDVLDEYLIFMETERRSLADARSRINVHIRPHLGHLLVADLDAKQIRAWFVGLAKAPRHVRTKEGKPGKHQPLSKDPDEIRARKANANRTLTVLKAALNRVWKDGNRITSDAAWRRVEPFESVDAARIRYLTVAEAKRLINACEPDFRRLVQAGLETGARYGELTRLQVQDFNPDSGTVAIRQSKSSKPRHVVLTEEGAQFFRQVCAGRQGREIMLPKADGSAWGASHQARPMLEACERAEITPAIGFHGLRHTWASLAVMAAVPLMVVAKNLGHSDTRMVEKHYGHLAPSFIADAIRSGAPRFGLTIYSTPAASHGLIASLTSM
jgi:integrase